MIDEVQIFTIGENQIPRDLAACHIRAHFGGVVETVQLLDRCIGSGGFRMN